MEGEQGVSRSMSSSSSLDPARSEETCERRAGMVRRREARCTVGVELESGRLAIDVGSSAGVAGDEAQG